MPLTQAEIAAGIAEGAAMLEARDAARQTPAEVRRAFLAQRRQVGPVFVEPFSLGILWLFEEIAHPFNRPEPLLDDAGKPVLDAGGNPRSRPLSMRDTARAIFIFNDSESAADALAEGLQAFDAAAISLARGIAPADLPRISETITKTFTEGLATIPGAGASNPPVTGS